MKYNKKNFGDTMRAALIQSSRQNKELYVFMGFQGYIIAEKPPAAGDYYSVLPNGKVISNTYNYQTDGYLVKTIR